MIRGVAAALVFAMLGGAAGGAVLSAAGDPPGPSLPREGESVPVPSVASPRADDGLPPVLPASPEVKEPLFSLLIGMTDADVTGVISAARLRAAVARRPRPSRIPDFPLVRVERFHHPGPPWARVRFQFGRRLAIPVPYSILGYRPGKVRISSVLELTEWRPGTVVLDAGGGGNGPRRPVEITDVVVWGISQGFFEVDIDGWLDALMGSKLDDTRVVGFAVFRYQGKLLGAAMGYSSKGHGNTGVFDFGRDEIVFPITDRHKAIGRYLRGWMEHRMPGLRRFRGRR